MLAAGEPGRFQVQAALQPLAGGLMVPSSYKRASSAAFRARRSSPVGQPARFRCLVAVDPGTLLMTIAGRRDVMSELSGPGQRKFAGRLHS